MTLSLVQQLADLPREERHQTIAALTPEEASALINDWRFWARPAQLPPDGPWSTIWISGGRRSGKTVAGAQAAAELARQYPHADGAIIAPTFQADAIRKCIEGQSGILKPLGPLVRDYNRGEGVIYLHGGGTIFATGANDGALRIQGENLAWAHCDEVGLWPRSTWKRAWEESIQFAVMLPPAKIICTGTPKAGHPLVKHLEADPDVIVQRLRTIDNRDNLDDDTVMRLMAKYQGTRLGAQELEGMLVGEVEGALWTWDSIEEPRMRDAPPMIRIVVGVDPSGGANEIGIVAAGEVSSPCPCGTQDERGAHYAVLEDRSLISSPERWAQAVVGLYHDLEADRVIAEPNFGGDMVASTIRIADAGVPVKMVTSSRGKHIRAEPISALFEQRRVHHVGIHADLETELTGWVPGDNWSPNRLDALVIAMTELIRYSGEAELFLSDVTIMRGVG